MLTVTSYLSRAEQCDLLANTARTPEEAKTLRQMAAMWRELAEAREREARRTEGGKELQSLTKQAGPRA